MKLFLSPRVCIDPLASLSRGQPLPLTFGTGRYDLRHKMAGLAIDGSPPSDTLETTRCHPAISFPRVSPYKKGPDELVPRAQVSNLHRYVVYVLWTVGQNVETPLPFYWLIRLSPSWFLGPFLRLHLCSWIFIEVFQDYRGPVCNYCAS